MVRRKGVGGSGVKREGREIKRKEGEGRSGEGDWGFKGTERGKGTVEEGAKVEEKEKKIGAGDGKEEVGMVEEEEKEGEGERGGGERGRSGNQWADRVLFGSWRVRERLASSGRQLIGKKRNLCKISSSLWKKVEESHETGVGSHISLCDISSEEAVKREEEKGGGGKR